MDKIELNIIALTNSESHRGSFALVLEDTKNKRRLPITIGLNEAQSIAVVLEKMQPLRPQTHDLLQNVITELGAQLKEVVINDIIDEKYYARLILKSGQKILSIDARTSDAIALAIRFDCPIYSYEAILQKNAFHLDEEGIESNRRGSFINYPLKELEELLKKVIAKEDYESATRIRDVINRKKSMK